MKFGGLKIGEKAPVEDEETAPPKEESFGEAGAGMAARSFVKALGLDPDTVDMGKATKALRAFVTACKPTEEDEDY